MNEFAINWIKGADYAEITVPSGTALKSKLLKLAEENRMKLIMWSSIKMVLWFAMHQFLISTFHQNEKYQKNRNLQPKNVSKKCGPRKKESLMNKKRNFWMRSWIPWMTNRWKKMIDIWQDGVRVYILPDDNFCLADNEL